MDNIFFDSMFVDEQLPDFSFATVGEVFADGVTLIFDGQSAATQKRYRCNVSAAIRAGDRVKICKDSGTYVVEYAVGAPNSRASGGLPSGGAAGSVLSKRTGDDGDVQWLTDAPVAAAIRNATTPTSTIQLGASFAALYVYHAGSVRYINFD